MIKKKSKKFNTLLIFIFVILILLGGYSIFYRNINGFQFKTYPNSSDIYMAPLTESKVILLLPVLVFIGMFLIWKKHGKDPRGFLTIVAEYEPPKNMKPTLVGSLIEGKVRSKDIIAGIVYLSEQGFWEIKKNQNVNSKNINYELKLIKKDFSKLEKTEQEILHLFFNKDSQIGEVKKISSFGKKNSSLFKLDNLILGVYEDMIKRGFYKKSKINVKIQYIVIGPIFAFCAIIVFGLIFGKLAFISSIVSGLIIMIFGFLMDKRTKLGSETRDKVIGFKKFLLMTEKERLEFHNAPEKNPKKLMEFLPYAIALGVDKNWMNPFGDISEAFDLTPYGGMYSDGKEDPMAD